MGAKPSQHSAAMGASAPTRLPPPPLAGARVPYGGSTVRAYGRACVAWAAWVRKLRCAALRLRRPAPLAVVPFARTVLRGGGGLNNFCITFQPELAVAERRDGGGVRKRAPNAAGKLCVGQTASVCPRAQACVCVSV